MTLHKLIFTGPVGAGKTTAISAISDVPVVTTDEQASDMTRDRKAATTVAMDFGTMKLAGGEQIHLYGTPGQERFNFMWEILTQGGIGLILLVDNSRDDPFADLRFFLDAFREFIAGHKVAIGVTRMDQSTSPSLAEYHKELRQQGIAAPCFEVDARRREDVVVLVQALLYSLDPWLGE